jgi:4-amino-4-deoxy-L-arabinose transferase-like glycosyltransferase
MSAKLGNLHKLLVNPIFLGLQHSRFLPVCFLAFIAIRLAMILFVPIAEPFSDSGWYLQRAITLVDEGSYSERGILTAYWPVGYPAFLALLFKVFGPSILTAQLANLILAAGSFWLLYLVVRSFLHDELVARASVALIAVYPNNLAYVPLVLTETLYTFLLLAACYCLLHRKQWLHLILAGCVFGLATLVKTQTLLFIPLLAALAFIDGWSIKNWARVFARIMTVILISLIVVTPWALRNYKVFGHFVLATNGGNALLESNNPSVVGDYLHNTSVEDPLYKKGQWSVENQMPADLRARALATGWIKDNPWQFVGLIPKKLFRLWAPDGEGEWFYQDTPFYQQYSLYFRMVRFANQAYYAIGLLLFPLALWRLFSMRASPINYLGVAVVLGFTLQCIVFSGQSRYHFPAMPFVLAYAAWVVMRPAGSRTTNQEDTSQ